MFVWEHDASQALLDSFDSFRFEHSSRHPRKHFRVRVPGSDMSDPLWFEQNAAVAVPDCAGRLVRVKLCRGMESSLGFKRVPELQHSPPSPRGFPDCFRASWVPLVRRGGGTAADASAGPSASAAGACAADPQRHGASVVGRGMVWGRKIGDAPRPRRVAFWFPFELGLSVDFELLRTRCPPNLHESL